MKIRHGTERALQTGPEVTNDEESIGKPFSFPLSEHQKWGELLSSEPTASHLSRFPPGLVSAPWWWPPPAGWPPGFHSMSAPLPEFLFMSGLFKESIFFSSAAMTSAAVLKQNFTISSPLRAYLCCLFGEGERLLRSQRFRAACVWCLILILAFGDAFEGGLHYLFKTDLESYLTERDFFCN